MREIKFTASYDNRIWNVETKKPKRSCDKGYYKSQGYILRLVTEHPFSDKRGYVREQRLVIEEKLGRFLFPKIEVVHHIDQDRSNNNISNLELVDQAKHAGKHLTGKRNSNGRLVATDPIFELIKFRLINKNTGLMEIKTLSQLIGKTYRRGQFLFAGRFTGLQDATGKDIYEGDVLSFDGYMTADNSCGYAPNGFIYGEDDIYKVIWDEELGGWNLDFSKTETEFIHKFRRDTWRLMKNGDCIIIGNIHENPELLSDQGKTVEKVIDKFYQENF